MSITAFTKTTALLFIYAGIISDCRAGNDSGNAAFFDSVATRFTDEYVECTGEARPVDLRRVIIWKRKMDEWTGSGEYAEVKRDYQKAGGAPIPPCKLIEWAKKRKQTQEAAESALIKALLDSAEIREALKEIKALPPSEFDIAEIPFGTSKLTFANLFQKKTGIPLQEKGRFLYVEELPVGGRNFLAAFYFNDDGVFYKYELEGDPLPAGSFNREVRPDADHLASYFEKRLGPPVRTSRVGYFDIKSRELAVHKKWEDAAHSLYIGFSVSDYRYYAKAVGRDKRLPPPRAHN